MKSIVFMTTLVAGAAFAGIDSRVPNIFTGNVMTNESVAFMGTNDWAPLMYEAEEILSVRSSDLLTEYEKDVDWVFDAATHRIKLSETSRIHRYTEEEFYPNEGRFACNLPGKAYVLFGEGATMHTNQVWVTYRHADGWTGPAPRDDYEAFAPLWEELFGCCRGNIVMYGDSITTGGNSTGTIGFLPRIPSWPVQVYTAITNLTGNGRLKYVNTAVGGMTSTWGLNNVEERVVAHDPKLALVAFGMNDGDATANYTNRIAGIVRKIHEGCPNAAVILVSPMIPNPEAVGFDAKAVRFPEYETALAALVDDFRAAGFSKIGLANVSTMHGAVLAKKRFRDMTGNNINHCNDFSARIYRDTILAALGVAHITCDGVTPSRKDAAWFDGGVAEGWPRAAALKGGEWRGTEAGDFKEGKVSLTNASEKLSFEASDRADLGKHNVMVTTRAKFTAFVSTPSVPEALTGIIAVHEGLATNYFVLAKSEAGGRYWRRLPDSAAKLDEEVEVTTKIGYRGSQLVAEYKIGEYVSPAIKIGAADTVGTVDFAGAGKVSALSAIVEKAQSGLILIIRGSSSAQ